jgi:hypothetical protein
MCARQVLIALLTVLSLSACVSLESKWRWNGISIQDEADIRAALHKITNSAIVDLQPRSPEVPYQVIYTEDKKIYAAEKKRGKWQITDITNAIVY